MTTSVSKRGDKQDARMPASNSGARGLSEAAQSLAKQHETLPLVFRSQNSGSDTAVLAVIRQRVTCRRRQRRTRGVGLEDGKQGKLSAGLRTAQTLCTQTHRHTPTLFLPQHGIASPFISVLVPHTPGPLHRAPKHANRLAAAQRHS